MSFTILAGDFKGRKLLCPKTGVRPTTALLRKAFFDILREEIEGKVFCDLFAGSGAMGLEALSRGALFAYFVECFSPAFSCLKKNIHSLKVEKKSKLFFGEAHLILKKLAKSAVQLDIVYVDPPYDIKDSNPSSYPAILEFLDESPLCKKGSLIAVEANEKEIEKRWLASCSYLNLTDSRKFSSTYLHLLRKG